MAEELASAHGVINVDADLSKADAQAKKLEKTLVQLGERGEKATQRVEKGIDGINAATRRAEASRLVQSYRAAASSQIQEEKRITAAYMQELRQRDRIQRAAFQSRPNSNQLFGAVNQAASRGGRGGMFGGSGNFLGPGGLGSRIVGGLQGSLGAGLGSYVTVQAARAVVESTKLATAYDRQEVASRRLAGSQDALNKLLEAYEKASGGAVSKAIALENVTRLQATGFAKNATEIERFVKGTRGASIALGKPQDYIIQETQLAVSNTSQKRLDQIGLGIKEVTERVEILRSANRDLTKEAAFQEAVISLLNSKYGTLSDTLEGQATELERLAKAWDDLYLAMGQNAQGPVNIVAGLIAGAINNYAQMLKESQQASVQNQRTAFNRADTARSLGSVGSFFGRGSTADMAQRAGQTEAQYRANRILNNRQAYPEFFSGPRGDSPSGMPGPAGPRYDQDEMAAIRDQRQAQLDIEKDYNRAILDETNNYEEQRASTIRNYAKQMVREEEDFQRQRARATRDYDKSVADAIEDAQERDAETTEDYNDRIAEAREDSAKRLSEIEEEYAEDREKSLKDHRDRQLKAAGQLDAVAVLEERKRFARENEERGKNHKKQVNELKENLDETLEDAREAYEERLEDARKADQKRLDDMREAREQQIADENEDRALRIARAEEDQADALGEMDRQHAKRIAQIEEQAAEERAAWQTEFEKAMDEAGIYIEGYQKKLDALDELTVEWLDSIRDEMKKDIEEKKKKTYRYDPETGPVIPEYASGGRVGRSGLARVHAGEYVLSRGMLSGANPVPAGIANAINSTNNHRNVTIQAGAFNITTTPGMEMMVGDLVEERIIELLGSVM